MILQRVFLAAIIVVLLSGAQDGRTRNYTIRWSEAEFQRAKPYAKRHHVPWALVIALRKAENGQVETHGQISISSEIKALDPKEDWQVSQACRTLSRAIIDFVARNPEFVEEYDWKGQKTWEGFLWEYRTKFVNHLAFVGWVPEDNPKRWESNVLQLWEKEEKNRG